MPLRSCTGTPCAAPQLRVTLVQLLFLRRGRRHHVVDEEHEALGPVHLLDAEFLARLAEEDIGVAGEVVADDEVGARLDLVTGPHEGPAAGAGEDLLGHRLGNVGRYHFHHMAIIGKAAASRLEASEGMCRSSQTRRFATWWQPDVQRLATRPGCGA
jgi:hypothetical protein